MNQTPLTDTQKIKRKLYIHNTKESYQITRELNKRKKEERRNKKKQKKINKMSVITYLSIITLNRNELKRHRVAEWMKKNK